MGPINGQNKQLLEELLARKQSQQWSCLSDFQLFFTTDSHEPWCSFCFIPWNQVKFMQLQRKLLNNSADHDCLGYENNVCSLGETKWFLRESNERSSPDSLCALPRALPTDALVFYGFSASIQNKKSKYFVIPLWIVCFSGSLSGPRSVTSPS